MELSDTRTARPYICIVQNSVLGKLVQGDDQIVVPRHGSGTDCYEVILLWISPCLPSGAKHNKVWEFPLPRVKEGELGKRECSVKTYQTFESKGWREPLARSKGRTYGPYGL